MSHHIGNTNKMVSDTPKTDKAQFGAGQVTVHFARKLERELNAAQKRIKRLEEAGDKAICPLEYAARVRIWTKAKEAKP